MDLAAATAIARFGLGARPGQPIPADPRAWLAAQLASPAWPDPARFGPAPTAARGLEALRADRRDKPAPGKGRVAATFRADAAQAASIALLSDTPFRERLVWFWANHFTVSRRAGGVTPLAGAFIAEAIRPHVTGRFSDMLLAVMRHPAMLIYLNNAGSVGPDSRAGRRGRRGLNENLARECLELHTVTPQSGYTQADVTNFARILTGWSIDLRADPPGFLFRPFAHEPGPGHLMGHSFPAGEAGGVAALRFLADHPATHAALARKLAVHFIADAPPPGAVAALTEMLARTQGDLGAAAAALIARPEAWRPGTKLRAPQDFVFATLRAAGAGPIDPARPYILGALASLGQPLWDAPQPNGWPDRAADWAGPAAMLRRVGWSYGVAGRLHHHDPAEFATATLGAALHPATATAIAHAGSRRDALALFLSSPEFQRR
ncbi:MAG: DUF1800 domain-containing protein [Rhodospirillales bacterium]|nr:DUF1800 domain-containing protein [Rhodospirillales bacterium]